MELIIFVFHWPLIRLSRLFLLIILILILFIILIRLFIQSSKKNGQKATAIERTHYIYCI